MKRIAAYIPARAGSEGLPGKNARIMAGRPMWMWTVRAAHLSHAVSTVFVGTDDPMVAAATDDNTEVHWRRRHTGADATMADVLKDFVLENQQALGDMNGLAVLYPTYPCRTEQDIAAACYEFRRTGRPIIGVKRPDTSPYLCVELDDSDTPVLDHGFYRRQDHPERWELTHSACVLPLPLPTDLSSMLLTSTTRAMKLHGPVIDVDTLEDFQRAEAVLKERHG